MSHRLKMWIEQGQKCLCFFWLLIGDYLVIKVIKSYEKLQQIKKGKMWENGLFTRVIKSYEKL